jgi:hypothetical protein
MRSVIRKFEEVIDRRGNAGYLFGYGRMKKIDEPTTTSIWFAQQQGRGGAGPEMCSAVLGNASC